MPNPPTSQEDDPKDHVGKRDNEDTLEAFGIDPYGDQRDQIDHPHEDEIEVGIAGQRRGERRQIEPTIQGCPEKFHVFIFEPYSPVFYS